MRSNLRKLRLVVFEAVRQHFEATGYDPDAATADDALAALAYLSQQDKRLMSSRWYLGASDDQVKLFVKEWNSQQPSDVCPTCHRPLDTVADSPDLLPTG